MAYGEDEVHRSGVLRSIGVDIGHQLEDGDGQPADGVDDGDAREHEHRPTVPAQLPARAFVVFVSL